MTAPAAPPPPAAPRPAATSDGVDLATLDDLQELAYLSPEQLDAGVYIAMPTVRTHPLFGGAVIVLGALLFLLTLSWLQLYIWLLAVVVLAFLFDGMHGPADWVLRLSRGGVSLRSRDSLVELPWSVLDAERLPYFSGGLHLPLDLRADLDGACVSSSDRVNMFQGLLSLRPPFLRSAFAPKNRYEKTVRDLYRQLRDQAAPRPDAASLTAAWPALEEADSAAGGRQIRIRTGRLPLRFLRQTSALRFLPLVWAAVRVQRAVRATLLQTPRHWDYAALDPVLRDRIAPRLIPAAATPTFLARIHLHGAPGSREVLRLSDDGTVLQILEVTLHSHPRSVPQLTLDSYFLSRLADGRLVLGSAVPPLHPPPDLTWLRLGGAPVADMLAEHRARAAALGPLAVLSLDAAAQYKERVYAQRLAAGLYTAA